MVNEKLKEPIINGEMLSKNGNTRAEILKQQKKMNSKFIQFSYKDADEQLRIIKEHKKTMLEMKK